MRADVRHCAAGVALACAACNGAGDGPRHEVVDSAGVAIVRNAGDDVPLEWRFEPVLTLGGAVDGPEAFYQVHANAVDVDAAGNLYILDRGNHRVVVFDPQGRHLRSMGRKGGGPGEFEWPAELVVSPGGVVEVTDFSKRGLIRFGPDGEVLRRRVVEEPIGQLDWTIDGLAVQTHRREGEARYQDLRLIDDTTSRLLLSVDVAPPRPINLGCVLILAPELFAPSLVWGAGANRVAVARGVEYVIDLHEQGVHVASVRRDLPVRSVTRDLAMQEIGDSMTMGLSGGRRCSAPADEVVEQRGYADVMPALGEIALAPDGTLWVSRREVKGVPRPTDLFAPTGQYLGTLPPGSPFPSAFTPDGGIVTVERDDLDVPRVVLYRIDRQPVDTP
jgi:hypothetical protein